MFGCKERGIYSELLAKIVFKKIFKKKEQCNGSRADVVTKRKKSYINVVVNFLSLVIFVCLFFFGMVIYTNEVETNEK